MYIQCLKIGYFPTKWKEAQGIMPPKPPRKSQLIIEQLVYQVK